MSIIEERYGLIFDRLASINIEEEIPAKYVEYVKECVSFMALMNVSYTKIQNGYLNTASLEELRKMNREIYEDVLPEFYETSYANPEYAVNKLGTEMGRMLSFVYTELRAMIPFVYEQLLEEVVIRMELFMEVLSTLCAAKEEDVEPQEADIKDTLYWFVSDYSDSSAAWRVKTQVNPECDFAIKIINNSDFSDLRYLYQYGEYINEDTERLASFINSLP